MAAQGSLIIFVWLIFNYAFKMNKYDKKFGVEEEEEKINGKRKGIVY